MFKDYFYIMIGVFCFLIVPNAYSQSDARRQREQIYKDAEKKYGPDDLLVFGKQYFSLHYNAEGNPYLHGDSYRFSQVFIQNKSYENVRLKFDVERQAFVLKHSSYNGTEKLIILNPLRLDSIRYMDALFVYSEHLSADLRPKVYYELIGNGPVKMYIYYTKYYDPVKSVVDSDTGGRYTKIYTIRSLEINGELRRVNSKRLFLSNFDKETARELKRFMRKNRIRYRKANSKQLEQLIRYCNEILSD